MLSLVGSFREYMAKSIFYDISPNLDINQDNCIKTFFKIFDCGDII